MGTKKSLFSLVFAEKIKQVPLPERLGGLARNYVYIPGAGRLAEKFADAFIKPHIYALNLLKRR
jgi:hypothetical protein